MTPLTPGPRQLKHELSIISKFYISPTAEGLLIVGYPRLSPAYSLDKGPVDINER